MGVPPSPRFSVRAEKFTATEPLTVVLSVTAWVYITLLVVVPAVNLSCQLLRVTLFAL